MNKKIAISRLSKIQKDLGACDDWSDTDGKHYADRISDDMMKAEDITGNKLGLWNGVDDIRNDYDGATDVCSAIDFVDDYRDEHLIDDNTHDSSMKTLKSMKPTAFCDSYEDGDPEYLDPGIAHDIVGEYINLIRKHIEA